MDTFADMFFIATEMKKNQSSDQFFQTCKNMKKEYLIVPYVLNYIKTNEIVYSSVENILSAAKKISDDILIKCVQAFLEQKNDNYDRKIALFFNDPVNFEKRIIKRIYSIIKDFKFDDIFLKYHNIDIVKDNLDFFLINSPVIFFLYGEVNKDYYAILESYLKFETVEMAPIHAKQIYEKILEAQEKNSDLQYNEGIMSILYEKFN